MKLFNRFLAHTLRHLMRGVINPGVATALLFFCSTGFAQNSETRFEHLITTGGRLTTPVTSGVDVRLSTRFFSGNVSYHFLPVRWIGVGTTASFNSTTNRFASGHDLGLYASARVFPLSTKGPFIPFAGYSGGYLWNQLDYSNPAFPADLRGFYETQQYHSIWTAGCMFRFHRMAGLEIRTDYEGERKIIVPAIQPETYRRWRIVVGVNLWLTTNQKSE